MTSIRVFVNSNAVDAQSGASALDCVRAWRTDEADSVMDGTRVITDSRGLPIPADSPARAGSIYRTIPNRSASAQPRSDAKGGTPSSADDRIVGQ
jgi:hypothetical protein